MLKMKQEMYIDGRSICVEDASIETLQESLAKLKEKEKQIITKQNELLSEIL